MIYLNVSIHYPNPRCMFHNTIEFKLTVPQLDMEKTLYSIAAPKLPNKKPVLVK